MCFENSTMSAEDISTLVTDDPLSDIQIALFLTNCENGLNVFSRL